jgi:hypothetical protein
MELVGYHYARDCITHILENKSVDANKIIFSTVANKHGTDGVNVERCIRTFINKIWKGLEMFDTRPSSREFIMKCSERIYLDFTCRSAYDILLE